MKFSQLFFWWEWVEKIVIEPFWWVLATLIVFWVPFLRVWWWILVPIFLWEQVRTLYLWWIAWDVAYAKTKWVFLEIVPPKEVLTPIKAMEDVFTVIWPIYDSANWREIWCDGELDNSPYWMSWEIASIEGNIHFYIRVMAQHRGMVESALYGHYPEIEIHEVPDCTKLVPRNIPNSEWDIYGEDFLLIKDPGFPIKTYEKFFEPQGERISAEEKRIDPINSLLESLSKLGPNEHFWFQMVTVPIGDKENEAWKPRAQKLRDKFSKRPVKVKKTFFDEILGDLSNIIFGPQKEGSGESAKYSWKEYDTNEETGERELVVTPGEREIITEMENKIRKSAFRTVVRGVYVAKRENWKNSNKTITRGYFAHFTTQNMNELRFTGDTRPKSHWILRKRIPYYRARMMLQNAIMRFPSKFPDRETYTAILSAEELATIFHFPIKITGLVSPGLQRVESKKSSPPPNLPIG